MAVAFELDTGPGEKPDLSIASDRPTGDFLLPVETSVDTAEVATPPGVSWARLCHNTSDFVGEYAHAIGAGAVVFRDRFEGQRPVVLLDLTEWQRGICTWRYSTTGSINGGTYWQDELVVLGPGIYIRKVCDVTNREVPELSTVTELSTPEAGLVMERFNRLLEGPVQNWSQESIRQRAEAEKPQEGLEKIAVSWRKFIPHARR